MPRRNHRDGHYPPLDLTPSDLGPHAGRTAPERRNTQELFAAQQKATREAAERQRKARLANAIDWSACLVPGCGETPSSHWADLYDRNPDYRLPLCTRHQAVVWKSVERDKANPAVLAATTILDELENQDRAVDQHKRDKEEHLKRTAGDLYFIKLNGLIKVGWTRDLPTRIKSYGASVEVLCHYPGSRDDETNLHRQLKPARARGREWYHDGDIIRMYIDRAIAQHGAPRIEVVWTEPKEVVRKRQR